MNLSIFVGDGVGVSEGGLGMYPYTSSLLELSRCTPSRARVLEGPWARVVTPLKASVWEKLLCNHPDRDFVQFICTGIREGFRIGFNGALVNCRSVAGNLRSVKEHSEVVRKCIEEEKEAGSSLVRDAFPWGARKSISLLTVQKLGNMHER